MLTKELSDYLNSGCVLYSTKRHPPAYSAQEVARQVHMPGRWVAKTVAVKLDGELALCIIPASERVNFGILGLVAGARSVELASEEELSAYFPHCEPGVMPAFGNLYGLSVFLSESLKGDQPLAFSSDNASERVVLSWLDFTKLVKPVILSDRLRNTIG
ncbi:YbaK/EbsC family protein [Endozoicomonas sp. Mp262]|uniref:aminoacyl-tRNA deacylase n=1 Tax=Endozoicomonas sp. Mp262 TaxID=2919499 RepID=UPI0021DAA190